MVRVILASGYDQGYEEKAQPFIRSLKAVSSDVDKIVFTTGFHTPNDGDIEYVFIEYPIDSATSCLQHGAYLFKLLDMGYSINDLVVFTDADIVYQRDILAEDIPNDIDRNIYVGLDCWYDTSLYTMAKTIGIRNKDLFNYAFPNSQYATGYNTGVLVGTIRNLLELHTAYMRYWYQCNQLLDHYAKQQFCLSWAMHNDVPVKELPLAFHTHTHYGIPSGVGVDTDGKTLLVDGMPVLIRHKYRIWD